MSTYAEKGGGKERLKHIACLARQRERKFRARSKESAEQRASRLKKRKERYVKARAAETEEGRGKREMKEKKEKEAAWKYKSDAEKKAQKRQHELKATGNDPKQLKLTAGLASVQVPQIQRKAGTSFTATENVELTSTSIVNITSKPIIKTEPITEISDQSSVQETDNHQDAIIAADKRAELQYSETFRNRNITETERVSVEMGNYKVPVTAAVDLTLSEKVIRSN
ncbi:uncharacterized protein LOC136085448 [Hydra vulgaris]|uniref:Uncharacterized protein LOC136085448 n=1 Tax=Hydra vulgaris TaxID=6087 RepID=A0ABM4CLZ0_HYDVU